MYKDNYCDEIYKIDKNNYTGKDQLSGKIYNLPDGSQISELYLKRCCSEILIDSTL